MSAVCVVCRRGAFMGVDGTVGPTCADCLSDYGRLLGKIITGPKAADFSSTTEGIEAFDTATAWAAKRAWEFAEAQLDATLAPQPGDPGGSRSRVRRRR